VVYYTAEQKEGDEMSKIKPMAEWDDRGHFRVYLSPDDNTLRFNKSGEHGAFDSSLEDAVRRLQADSDELAKIKESLRTPGGVIQVGRDAFSHPISTLSMQMAATQEIAELRAAVAAIEDKIANGWTNAFQADEIGKFRQRLDRHADFESRMSRLDLSGRLAGLEAHDLPRRVDMHVQEMSGLRERIEALEHDTTTSQAQMREELGILSTWTVNQGASLEGLLDSVGKAHSRLDALKERIHDLENEQIRSRSELAERITELNTWTAGRLDAHDGNIRALGITADLLEVADREKRDRIEHLYPRLESLEPAVGQIGIEVQRLVDARLIEQAEWTEAEIKRLETALAEGFGDIAQRVVRLEDGRVLDRVEGLERILDDLVHKIHHGWPSEHQRNHIKRLEDWLNHLGSKINPLETAKVLERLAEVEKISQRQDMQIFSVGSLARAIERLKDGRPLERLTDLELDVGQLGSRVAALDSLAVNNDVRIGALEAGEAQNAETLSTRRILVFGEPNVRVLAVYCDGESVDGWRLRKQGRRDVGLWVPATIHGKCEVAITTAPGMGPVDWRRVSIEPKPDEETPPYPNRELGERRLDDHAGPDPGGRCPEGGYCPDALYCQQAKLCAMQQAERARVEAEEYISRHLDGAGAATSVDPARAEEAARSFTGVFAPMLDRAIDKAFKSQATSPARNVDRKPERVESPAVIEPAPAPLVLGPLPAGVQVLNVRPRSDVPLQMTFRQANIRGVEVVPGRAGIYDVQWWRGRWPGENSDIEGTATFSVGIDEAPGGTTQWAVREVPTGGAGAPAVPLPDPDRT
jgi:hypothetical protein